MINAGESSRPQPPVPQPEAHPKPQRRPVPEPEPEDGPEPGPETYDHLVSVIYSLLPILPPSI